MPVPRSSTLLVLVVSLLWAGAARAQNAQPAAEEMSGPKERIAPPLDPKQMGLRIPAHGKVEPGREARVVVADETGQPVVAQLLCKVADTSLIVLPSGRLKSAKASETTPTERSFEPLAATDLLKRLHSGQFKNFKTATSKHYAFLYACQESFYQVTRDILESLYDGVDSYLQQWKVPCTQPQAPLVVLILPDRATFKAFSKMPEQVLAFYSPVNNFVVLHEDPELSDAAPELALKRASYTIAHEGVHQILHNVGVQRRLAPWPEWLAEGLPELFCPVEISSNMVKEGSDSMPKRNVRWSRLGLVNDLRMYDLLEMKSAGGAVVEKMVTAESLDADGYALAWGLAHYLSAKQAKAFRNYLREVSALEPLADFNDPRGPSQRKLFVKHFGDDFAQLEAAVAKYLNSPALQSIYRDPMVYQTHYAVVHTARRGRATQVTVFVTTSPEGARQWKEKEIQNQQAGVQHNFRTQACATRKEAEAIIAKIGRR